jgi:hypothetical protein
MITQGLVGSELYYKMQVTATNTAGNFLTPLASVKRVQVKKVSQTTGGTFTFNVLESGTAAAGYIAVSSCTSGDEWWVTAYGF